ncbi:MAG: sensor domain-containing protein [Candidatus Aminicenantes bacterium]|nr:MAG: sensor domain-containing protein [Candidatus Aminicenantes bacterium]
MCKDVQDYLAKLKKELSGSADPALVQDALSDAETHLRTALEEELSNNPGMSENEILAPLVVKYGTPSEVAAAYLAIEPHISPALSHIPRPDTRSFLGKFFGVLAESRAWGAFFYMLLAFITGIIFGGWALLGGIVSASSLIFIIGLPIFGLFLLSIRGIALLEGRIVEALLGVRMPRRPMFLKKGLSWSDRYIALVKDKYSWRALLYAVLLFPLGLIYSTFFILFLAFSLSFIASPVMELFFRIPLDLFGDNVFTPVWLLPLVCAAGIILLPLSLHLAKLVGKIHGQFAKSMLVRK